MLDNDTILSISLIFLFLSVLWFVLCFWAFIAIINISRNFKNLIDLEGKKIKNKDNSDGSNPISC